MLRHWYPDTGAGLTQAVYSANGLGTDEYGQNAFKVDVTRTPHWPSIWTHWKATT